MKRSRLAVITASRRQWALPLGAAVLVLGSSLRAPAADFIRGDVNVDGRINWADVAAFAEISRPGITVRPFPCTDAADIDDDGRVRLDSVPVPEGPPIVSDLNLLIEFLFRLRPLRVDFRPPLPFPDAGPDPTADVNDCRTGIREPPASSRSYSLIWETPERVESGNDFEIVLRITTAQAVRGLSLAYLVDSSVLDIGRVEIVGGLLDPVAKRQLEGSRFFRWELADVDDPDSRLLMFAVNLVDEGLRPLDAAPTRGSVRALPFLRISGVVRPDAPPGPRKVLRPYDGDYGDGLGVRIGGLRTGFVQGSGVETIDIPDLSGAVFPVIDVGEIVFLRADTDADGEVTLTDAVNTLTFLFLSPSYYLAAPDAADANDDGEISLTDAVFTLNFLFLGQRTPPPPFPGCGEDPTDDDDLGGFHTLCFP